MPKQSKQESISSKWDQLRKYDDQEDASVVEKDTEEVTEAVTAKIRMKVKRLIKKYILNCD